MLLVGLCLFAWVKNQFREHDSTSLLAWRIVIAMTVISVGDNLWGLIDQYHYAWGAALIRPFYLVVSIRVLRIYCVRYLLVIKDSVPIMVFTLTFILYFSMMAQRLFQGTLQGVKYFNSRTDAFYSMFVLITTSNYPDIMLPSY